MLAPTFQTRRRRGAGDNRRAVGHPAGQAHGLLVEDKNVTLRTPAHREITTTVLGQGKAPPRRGAVDIKSPACVAVRLKHPLCSGVFFRHFEDVGSLAENNGGLPSQMWTSRATRLPAKVLIRGRHERPAHTGNKEANSRKSIRRKSQGA